MNGCYNVEIPEGFLDNDFCDADLDRFLDEFERCDPSVAVVGDAYSMDEAQLYNEVVEKLRENYPYKTFVVAPKDREAARELDGDIVLGFANGYSDIQGEDLGYSVFRGRDVHLLGSSPFEQHEAIQKLTQPNLNGDPPANVVGVDWNGPHKVAYKGEYWSRDGWQPADHLSIRETVRESLKEVKAFWQDQSLWPTTTSVEIEGLPVEYPDNPVYAVSGSDIENREDLEESYMVNRDGQTLAFESETAKKFFEYREGYL